MEGKIILAFILLRISVASADCDNLPAVADIDLKFTGAGDGPYASGTTVKLECKLGFNPMGRKVYTCSGTEWIDGDLTCEQIYCTYVKKPDNGREVNTPTYEVGTSIKFECNEGYALLGNSIMVCRTDGLWSPTQPPTCQIKMCGDFGSIQHGTTFQDSSNSVRDGYGSIVEVTCDSNYVINGAHNVMCQANGQWEEKPTCKYSDCPPYPGLDSSCIKHAQTSGSFFFVICRTDVPVTRTGSDAAECIRGEWDDTGMACYCDCKVEADMNLVSINNAVDGYIGHTSTLDWSCKNGSTKVTAGALVCNDGNLTKPICKSSETTVTYKPVTDENGSADCDNLPAVADIDLKFTGAGDGPYASGTTVKLECKLGFKPMGRKVYTCSGTEWIDGDLTCEQIYCTYVKKPDNGRVVNTPTYEVGTSIKFECHEGYDMLGNSIMVCRTDGLWSPTQPPTCQIKMCGDFGSIQHGTTFQDSSNSVRDGYGSIVEVTCDSNYVINGAPNVMCQANGQWEEKPTCKYSDCPPYPGLDSSCIKRAQTSGSFFLIICRTDVPVTRTGGEAAECIHGEWNDTGMACYCGCKVEADMNLVSINNAVDGYIGHTSTLDWSCKNGSTKVTAGALVCNDGNLTKPICKSSETTVTYKPVTDENGSADCDNLPAVADIDLKFTGAGDGPYASGTTVKLECKLGFKPMGRKVYTCSGTEWIDGDLTCEQIYCTSVKTPDNGRVVNTPTYEVGTSIKFECNEGYDVLGNSIMVCRTDGLWSPTQPPTCQIKMCGDFGSIQHGTTFQDSSNSVRDGYGSIVEVTCDSNYVINGAPNVMCQANGQWEEKPTCKYSDCPPYPGLDSSCIKRAQTSGSFFLIICRTDVPVTRTGGEAAECIHGEWNDTGMACYCGCKVEADMNLVSISNAVDGYIGHTSTLNWSCKKGSTKVTTGALVCNDGNLTKPICKSSETTVTYKPVTDENGSADCDNLPAVADIDLKFTGAGDGPYASGTTVKLECKLGFKPMGRKAYTCSGTEWIDGDLTCEQIYCTSVKTPDNGRVVNTPTYEVGTSIKFECNEGYDMLGNSIMVCRTDGLWSPTQPPTCQIKMCGDFGSIQHGTTFQDSSNSVRDGYGSIVEVTCDSNYVINGAPNVMCQANDQWEETPTCKYSDCPPYPGLDSSCIKRAQTSGSFFLIICRTDVPVTRTGGEAAECIHGEWNDTGMACYCGCKVEADMNLVSINNAVNGYIGHTSTLNWSCKNGSTKVTTGALVCNDGNLTKPICKSSETTVTYKPVTDENGSADCDNLPAVADIDLKFTGAGDGPYASGTTVKLECKLGFKPMGRKVYTCSGTEWIDGDLTCEQIYCTSVKTPDNGRVVNTPTYEVGTSIKFECNEGYDMLGNSIMVCRTDGLWSPTQPPTCQIKMCGDFGSIQHGTTFQDSSNSVRYGYESIVEVTCDSNYVINGAPNVMCQANGQWEEKPTCKYSDCPPYPGLDSSCIKRAQTSGSFFLIICRTDVPVTRTGGEAAECIHGEWNDTGMACYCGCKVEADMNLVLINNAVDGYIGHTSTLDWSCKNGSTKVTAGALVCNDGNLTKPICKSSETTVTYKPVTDENGSADCDNLPAVADIDLKFTGAGDGPYASGTTVKLECKLGFKPMGRKVYTCSGTEWIDGDLTCEQIYCTSVKTPDNGRVVNTPTYEVGTSIKFECNEGYDVLGNSIMVCRTDGLWSPTQPPTCQIKMCGDFGSIQHGTTFQDSSNSVRDGYGSIVEVTCDSNYVINGAPNVMCQANGQWEEKPTCKYSDCPPYPGLDSSCIKRAQTSGSFFLIICRTDVPVTRTGGEAAECIHGEWNDTGMACYCGCKVEADMNLVLINNAVDGYIGHTSTLDWSCKNGSTKVTAGALVCNDGNLTKPICKSSETTVTYKPVTDENGSADCDNLPAVADIDLKFTGAGDGPYASGTTVKLECKLGFKPMGRKVYTCSGTEWIDGDLTCEQIYCTSVKTPDNGRVVNTPTYEVGTSIKFECNEGYDMLGNSIMVCRTDGLWSPTQPPTCQIKMCGDFGSIQHGTTFQDSSDSVRDGYGSIVEVTCDSNYVINGAPNVMCQANGQWEEKPTCKYSDCPPYPGLDSSCIKRAQTSGSFFLIICRTDVPVTRTGGEAAECIHGEWNDTGMACYCGCKVEADMNLVSINNAVNGYIGHTSTLNWSCKKGSTKFTTGALVCNDGNLTKPICKSSETTVTYKPVTDENGSADCDNLPAVADIDLKFTGAGDGPYASGTTVKLECKLGFKPMGRKVYTCSGTEWIDGDLTCEQIYCTSVKTPDNGRVVNTPTYEVGTSIKFECNEGYDMLGNSIMVCRTDGLWSPTQPPTCQIKMCGDFGSIQHGTTFQDSSNSVRDGYGSIVEVTCDSNYVINGAPNVMCQANGQWEEKPTCKYSDCPPYPGLDSSCIKRAQTSGSFFFIICRTDVPVTRTGGDAAECIRGEWDDTRMACYCDCKVEADKNLVSINNAVNGYIGHTSTLDWSCKKGSTKVTTGVLVCNDGNLTKPLCKSSETTVTYKSVTDENGSTVNPPPTTLPPITPEKQKSNTILIVVICIVIVIIGAGAFVVGFYLHNKKQRRKDNPGKKTEETEMLKNGTEPNTVGKETEETEMLRNGTKPNTVNEKEKAKPEAV